VYHIRSLLNTTTTAEQLLFIFKILWLRDDPFELISIGGERHTLDQRYWAGSPDYNDSFKHYYVSSNLISNKGHFLIASFPELGFGHSTGSP